MEVGYFTMPLHPPGSDPSQTYQDDLEQIVALDSLGYKEAWIGEHLTAEWENIPAPDLFIAAALAVTKTIALGTGVTCMPNHNPFMVALRIAQLDHMAKGRFLWGVGSGGFPGDLEAAGFDPKGKDHRTMTIDAIDLILQIWDNPTPGLYETKYWKFTIPESVEDVGLSFHMKPFQKPHPPIAAAGVSASSDSLVLAGERGWIPMSIHFVPAQSLPGHWDSVETGAKNAGRKADRSTWRIARDIYVAETTEKAREDVLNGTIARDYENYWFRLLKYTKQLDRLKVDSKMSDSDVNLEYVLDNIMIVGSPEEVTAKLRRLYEDVGGFGVLLSMGHEWQPKDKWTRSMALLSQEVIPNLSDIH